MPDNQPREERPPEPQEADQSVDELLASTYAAGRELVTSDKDLAQLVREDGRVILHDLAKELPAPRLDTS